MAVTKFLARDLTIYIAAGSSGSGSGGGDFIQVKGLNSLTHSPSSTDADTTDFDDQGHETHLKAARGESWTLAGFRLEDVANGVRDPGQAAVEEIAQAIGLDSLATFKITSPGGNSIVFRATAEVTLPGGGNNDAAAWQATVKVSGKSTFA